MTEATIPTKDPSDILPVGFDAKAYLRSRLNETIDGVVFTSTPSGLSLSDPDITGTIVSTVVSGGAAGTIYEVKATITTTLGMRYERTLELPVEQR